MVPNTNQPHGVLLIDKPVGITSHDVIDRLRRIVRATIQRSRSPKIGHAGTLDPFAMGLLVVGMGNATRLLEYTHDWDKEYVAAITLGATSTTDDLTGELSELPNSGEVSLKDVEHVIRNYIGTFPQVPPNYAAIKVRGKKLYEYARAGEVVPVTPRQITISAIEILSYTYPKLILRITCSTGTYIRSLARDIGGALGVGGYCSALRRTRHGTFRITEATSLDTLNTEIIATTVQPPATLIAHLPRVTLTAVDVAAFYHGQVLHTENVPVTLSPAKPLVAVFTVPDQLIGIGRYAITTQSIHPEKVMVF